ncbi:hypothetical protein AAFF_G00055650 [Aldrovandia affinis]|uniref:Uncharacterized protein n=1 Tax=Aldrovandia affinis TaxID=143900 RepID=A0AAD7WE68_9TELE|nr:hypothetical protein AAFF_G00055650 [Aldrovandia affinis]
MATARVSRIKGARQTTPVNVQLVELHYKYSALEVISQEKHGSPTGTPDLTAPLGRFPGIRNPSPRTPTGPNSQTLVKPWACDHPILLRATGPEDAPIAAPLALKPEPDAPPCPSMQVGLVAS